MSYHIKSSKFTNAIKQPVRELVTKKGQKQRKEKLRRGKWAYHAIHKAKTKKIVNRLHTFCDVSRCVRFN